MKNLVTSIKITLIFFTALTIVTGIGWFISFTPPNQWEVTARVAAVIMTALLIIVFDIIVGIDIDL